MKVLITGGAGFIGSHLADAYLKQGDEVYIIDNLSTGSINNIEHLKGKQGFHYVIDSIMNKSLTAELVDAVDIIFHLAAAVGVQLIVKNPVHTIETNIKGTELILELASNKKKPTIIFSTSEVYGKSSKDVFSENDDLVLGSTYTARWSYAASKIIDEFLALAYHKEKQLPVIVVRLFNTVGPRQTGQYGMVIPRFISQALSNKPITVYGDGQQTRTFVHVIDVINALMDLIKHNDAWGEIVNIGGESEISIISLAQEVKEGLNSSSEIEYISYSQAYDEGFEDMKRRRPDISKIKKLIGFKPKFTLTNVISDVAEHQRNKGL